MAEGFARAYGADILQPISAGLAPASLIMPLTRQVMEEKNIQLEGHYPKPFDGMDLSQCDLLVNISNRRLPKKLTIPTVEWRVQDPIGEDEETYLRVRDQIEGLVMKLILDLRRKSSENQTANSSVQEALAAVPEDSGRKKPASKLLARPPFARR